MPKFKKVRAISIQSILAHLMRTLHYLATLSVAVLCVRGSGRKGRVSADGRPTKSATTRGRRSGVITTTSPPSSISVAESPGGIPLLPSTSSADSPQAISAGLTLKRKPDPRVSEFATPPRPVRRAAATADTPLGGASASGAVREEGDFPKASGETASAAAVLDFSEGLDSAIGGSLSGEGVPPAEKRRAGRVRPVSMGRP